MAYEIHYGDCLYTVGTLSVDKNGNQRWMPISDHPTKDDAIKEINFLNGGSENKESESQLASRLFLLEGEIHRIKNYTRDGISEIEKYLEDMNEGEYIQSHVLLNLIKNIFPQKIEEEK